MVPNTTATCNNVIIDAISALHYLFADILLFFLVAELYSVIDKEFAAKKEEQYNAGNYLRNIFIDREF